MINEHDIYRIGTLTKTHGVGGELNLAFTDDAWDRAEADHLIIRVDGIPVPFFIEEYRFRTDTTAIIKFCDVDDEPAARELVGGEVLFERALVPDDHTPEYSWAEFVGLTVTDSQGAAIGTIADVDDTTENVLFSIATSDGDEHLVPAAEDLIHHIDWDARTITMTIPEGLLEL